MKKRKLFLTIIAVITLLLSCSKVLDLQPLDRVTSTQLFADQTGLQMVIATLYNRCPIEDYNYVPNSTMNMTGTNPELGGGWSLDAHTDNMVIVSNGGDAVAPTADGYWDYTAVRYINLFFDNIKAMKGTILTTDAYNRLWSEAHWLRAYTYYALVSRYGGVPIFKKSQVLGGDNSQLYVPRSTEKDTWDFVLAECDSAVLYLPATTPTDGALRATKWAAYALKSRAALHAASLAKYWNNAPLTGPAVDAKLVGGMTAADASGYYLQCINASKAIIDNSGKTLYSPTPANPAEAATNLQALFETPSVAASEIIYKKSYIDGVSTQQQGHQMDFYGYPMQLQQATAYMFGRMAPTLDLVNLFENYADNGVGAPGVLQTRSDGNETTYLASPMIMSPATPYIRYNTQYDIFTGKDARLFAWIMLPGSHFKDITLNCQGGLVKTDGTNIMYTISGTAVGLDGVTYYPFGTTNAIGFSAFGQMGTGLSANGSSTGFVIKKFLQEKTTPTPARYSGSTNDYIVFRLSEIYLNYAEAAIESGQGDAALAKTYLNAIRRRAAHTDQIPATVANILKERQVELCFEQRRYWDLIRRREFHTLFASSKRHSLVPVLDLRVNPPKYIFIRVNNYYDELANGITWNTATSYYRSIPGVSANNLIQNPGF
jgi:starch-binding outer membrane protein, SusD/RagB family